MINDQNKAENESKRAYVEAYKETLYLHGRISLGLDPGLNYMDYRTLRKLNSQP
jgi:hypothetical protein